MNVIKLEVIWNEEKCGWNVKSDEKEVFISALEEVNEEIMVISPMNNAAPGDLDHIDARSGVSVRKMNYLYENEYLTVETDNKNQLKRYVEDLDVFNETSLGVFISCDYPGLYVAATIMIYQSAILLLDYPKKGTERYTTVDLDTVNAEEFFNSLKK
uniref:Uncharacterized protein n=1 Tax=viral metagenome TaxID=1070528 RepID=A0A6H2A2U2_9ZZZZ